MDESKLIGGEWLVVKQGGGEELVSVEVAPGVRMKVTKAEAARWAEKSQRDSSRGEAGAPGDPEEKKRGPVLNKARRHTRNK